MIGNNVLAIINMHESDSDLGLLTEERVRGMLPFGGRYRLIDFALSRLSNVGVRDIGVLVPCKFSSVIDHLRNAKTWDLARSNGGLYLLVPKERIFNVNRTFKRDLEHLYTHIDFLRASKKEYVLMTGTSTIADMDHAAVLEAHMASKADITLVYCKNPSWVPYSEKTMSLAMEGDRITNVEYVQSDMESPIYTNMLKFIMKRELLISLMEECQERGETDIYKDIIFRNLDKLIVRGYQHTGYAMHINSNRSFFKYSMELLEPEVRAALFSAGNPVYTKSKNEPPTLYKDGSLVKNSLIANGCRIEGVVENCILHRGVTVEKGAVIKNSIIMDQCHIGEDVVLDHVIADKFVTFLPGKSLKGERTYQAIVAKGTVI